MADDMDDGMSPEIYEDGGLGFTPQRRNISNNLLPYADQLDKEIVEQLTIIKRNLTEAILLSDIKNGGLYWICRLHRFVKLYSYCFSKKDHVLFIELLYQVVVQERTDMWVSTRVAQTLLLLLKKTYLLSPDDLQLPWRPLYELHSRLCHSAVAYQGLLRLPSQCACTIDSVIRFCRPYFKPGTTEELLEEFCPRMCPFDEQMQRSIKYLSMFLPVNTRHNGRPPNYHLWKDMLLDMMRNSPNWEVTAFSILARLAWKNVGLIDWRDELPLYFTKILRSLRLPVGYRGMSPYMRRSYDTNAVAMFIVANLGGDMGGQEQLTRLVAVVESYLYPSNHGSWTSSLMDMLARVTLYFNKRINKERRLDNEERSWKAAVPADKRLTKEDMEAFVQCLLPVTLTALFGRAGTAEAAVILGRLAALSTNLVMTKFLDLMYPALSSSMEPQRLQVCLLAGVATARSLVTGGTDFPAAPTHVLPLLKLLLPGIDPNDINKTMSTFQLITTYVTLMPLADCSSAPTQLSLNEVETELCEQSAEFAEFLLVFLERCLNVVESCVSVQHQSQQQTAASDYTSSQPHTAMSKEETLQEAGMAFTMRTILQQCHPDICKSLVKRLTDYVIGRTLETVVAGKLLANMCRAAAKVQPELVLSHLVPPICRLLVSLTESQAAREDETPDNEIMFNLLILSEVMQSRCDAVMPYIKSVVEVLSQCIHLVCIPAQRLAVGLLGGTLAALTCTTNNDYRSVTEPWNSPYEEFLPIRHWGALVPGGWRALKLSWVEPGEEQRDAVSALLHQFVLPELIKLDTAAADLTALSRESLQQSLHIVQETLNAGPLLPPWEEDPIELYKMAVPSDCSPLVLSSKSVTVCFSADSGKPGNVRKAIANTILAVTHTMLEQDSDNTKAYLAVINILWSIGLLHTVKRSDYEIRWRTLSQVQRLLRNNLVGPGEYWYRVRHVMVQRSNLQHLSRTLEAVEAMPFTGTHRDIMFMAFRLATSNYSQVRCGGQQLLRNIFGQFSGSCLLLLPAVQRNLALDPIEHHKTFKGTLYVVLGGKSRGFVVRRDWPVLSKVWPSLVAAKHSEKPSITQLFSRLLDNIFRFNEMLAINEDVSEGIMVMANKVAKEWSVSLDDARLQDGIKLVADTQRDNNLAYHTLVDDIVNHLDSGKLPWRYEHLALGMLGTLIRTDVTYPAGAVRCIAHYCVHHNIHVRRVAVHYMSNVLRSQKRPHLKVILDPYTVVVADASKTDSDTPQTLSDTPKTCSDTPQICSHKSQLGSDNKQTCSDIPQTCPNAAKPPLIVPGDDKPDNRWLQYDPDSVNMTEERYEQLRYVHRTYFGYTGWPSELLVYAPASAQPPLDRSPDELPPGELEVYKLMSCPEKLQQLVDYLALEEQKAKERFDHRKMIFWKGIFRNFGPTFLPAVAPHLERLAADTAEASQRCAAEMLTGLIRATKHWRYADWRTAMELALSVLSIALTKSSREAKRHWFSCVSRISMDRDPNLIAPIVHMLTEVPDLQTTSSFVLCGRLQLCEAVLHQQQWRVMSVLQQLLTRLSPGLSHPYKTVRDEVSSLLYTVFCHGTALFYDGRLTGVRMLDSSPDLRLFVDQVMGQLSSLQEYSGGNSGDGGGKTSSVAAAAGIAQLPHHHIAGEHNLAGHLVPGVVAMVAEAVGGGGSSTTKAPPEDDEIEETSGDGDDDDGVDASMDERRSDAADVAGRSREAGKEERTVGFPGDVDESRDKPSEISTQKASESRQLPSPSDDALMGETDERKNAFRIINTMCRFIQIICERNHYSTPPPLYKMLGALCQLESVDSEQEVCSNCVAALCTIGHTLVRQQDIMYLLSAIRDISEYRWWRARSAALGVLQMVVFHNALTMMACEGARAVVLQVVLVRLQDERLEVRRMAAQVLASLLHIHFVEDPPTVMNKFMKELRKKPTWQKGLSSSVSTTKSSSSSIKASKASLWPSERLHSVHGAVLGLTAFVESAPYSVPPHLPTVLCILADHMTLPEPIAGSIRDSLSNFRRTHHDNWQEHKQHFTSDQLDTLNDQLLSPSYYA